MVGGSRAAARSPRPVNGSGPPRWRSCSTGWPSRWPGPAGAWFHGRRVMAVDGVVLDVPDTPENLASFTKYGSGGPKQSPYPQVRLVGLGECGTHAVVAAAFDA